MGDVEYARSPDGSCTHDIQKTILGPASQVPSQ